MLFGKKNHNLTGLLIKHRLPGRIRITCPAFKYYEDFIDAITQDLLQTEGVQWVKFTPITGNILIYYDEEKLTPELIIERLEIITAPYVFHALKKDREARMEIGVEERKMQEEDIKEKIVNIVATGATIAFSFFSKAPVAATKSLLGRFFTIPSLTALSIGLPIFKNGFDFFIKTGKPNADTLSSTAILASLLAGKDISALTIILLADIAELLTAYTMQRTRKAISEMLSVGEEFVWVLNEKGQEVRTPIDEVKVDDVVVVHNGEKISVDGVVTEGNASVDQSSITGEFLPMVKDPGDKVFAGTVLKSGLLKVKAIKVGDETAVARIIHLVEEATGKKAYIQAFADKFSAAFIPFNFALAILVYFLTKSPARALNMLIIDYSCGARLSTATALSAAICTAASNGILIKGGNYLEMMADSDTLILDKTGTLTEGNPRITSIITIDKNLEEKDVVEFASAAEETSNHPMALSVLNKVRKEGWKIPPHGETHIIVARGVQTTVDRDIIRVGSRKFMEENGIELIYAGEHVTRLVRRGENIIYVAKNDRLVGILGMEDTLRENMKKALNRLRNIGIDDLILLTGDVEQHAEIVAARMAMDSYRANVLPEDKAQVVMQLQSRGTHVIMAGDGINDAPALAYADVGIAMGGNRTDIAIEAADVTITGDDPLMIPAALRMARGTMNIIRENFAVTIVVNTLGLVLASIGILPVFWGAVLHNATTVVVVLNSARLLFFDFSRGR